MIGIAICFTLLTIMAALYLHAKTKDISRYYRWSTYFILFIASIVLILQIARGICGMCCHGGMCHRTEQCCPGMCKEGMNMKDGKCGMMMDKECRQPMKGCCADSSSYKGERKEIEEKKEVKEKKEIEEKKETK